MSRNKTGPVKRSLLNIKLKLEVYFFSGWIAKAGVVPLLRSATFLFLPIFFTLFFLRLTVTRVLETIFELLQTTINSIKLIRIKYLTHSICSVKIILLTFLWIRTATAQVPEKIGQESIILAVGQHRELSVPGLVRFTIGNKDAVSHKFFKTENRLLLKGNHLGYAELVMWFADGHQEIRHFYVVSKTRHLKIVHLAETLRSIGLTAELKGPLIVVSGKLSTVEGLGVIKKLQKKYANEILVMAQFEKKILKKILGEVYKKSFDEFVDRLKCQPEYLQLICTHPSAQGPSSSLVKYLAEKYNISFIPVEKRQTKNFRIKLKLFQLEKTDGEELHFGLDQLSGSLGDIFSKGVVGLLKENQILFNEQNIDFSTLAEPQTMIRQGKETIIQVGAEIPYAGLRTAESVITKTEWKFAGLKVVLDLNKHRDGYEISYSTEFTRPTDNQGNIVGNKEKSSALISPGKPVHLFEIVFKTEGTEKSRMPFLSKIPILGRLFTSTSEKSVYKNITGIILMEELDE